MTIGSPRRFFSNSRGRVIGRREASAGVWMFGCALMATQPPGCPLALRIVLSMRRVVPTLAATATSTSPSTRATGERSSGCDELEVVGLDAAPAHRGQRGGAQDARRRARRRPATPRRRPARRAGRARARGRRRAGARCGSRAPGRRARARWGRPRCAPAGRGRATSAADDERLLGVLLAEEGHVGPDHVQQLGHDGGDAVEVAHAAVRALERLGQAAHVHRRARSPAGRPRRASARRAGRRRPRRPARRRAPRRAGRRPGRRPSLNCAGLTKSETTTTSHAGAGARG